LEETVFDLKKEIMWAEVKAGIIISLALIVLFLGVFFAGGIEKIVRPRVDIRAAIRDVRGLKTGAPVWVYGIEEGSVKDVALNPEYGAIVTISLARNALGFLKQDSTATILTMGLLGDKYIELTGGTAGAPPLRPGDMIQGAAQFDMKEIMETSGASIEKLTEFMDRVGKFLDKVENSKGSLSRFIEDPSLYDNLKQATGDLSAIVKDIQEGRGTIGLLVKDPTVYERLANASRSLEGFSRDLDKGSGTLSKLLKDDTLYYRLTGATSSMEEFGKKLNDPSGTFGKLMADPQLYDNLSKASQRLSTILERMDKGESAAGVLMSDRETAQDLKVTIKELRELTGDIRQHPHKYFKFSLF
jgi:phospholipid/cholesterol/gamma-HCH transport system substrate-binding protein